MRRKLLNLSPAFTGIILTGLTISGPGKTTAQTPGFNFYVKDITVNAATPVEVTDNLSQPLNKTSMYRMHLVTRSTGTHSGAEYLAWYDPNNTTWNVRNVNQAGNNSNHPLLLIENNTVKVTTNHANNYPVRVFVQELLSAQANGTPHIFGPSYQWQRKTNTLFYTDGNVGIGTNTPAEKLSVNGRIRAKEVKVEVANWPDYVFLPDYPLPSLTEVRQHIDTKGHLPGIPTQAEAIQTGISLGRMNAKLLQKIEELTLYLLQQSEKIQQQDKLIQQQQEQINAILSRLPN